MLSHFFFRPHVLARLRKNILAPYLNSLAAYLQRRGHPVTTIQMYMRAVEHFGRWLATEGIPISAINKKTVATFLYRHLPQCRCAPPCPKQLVNARAALKHLQVIQAGDKDMIAAPKRLNPLDKGLQEYHVYLDQVCGLAPATCLYRIRYAREFLNVMFPKGPLNFDKITAPKLMKFMAQRTHQCRPGTAQVIGCSLRSYLRFLQLRGWCKHHLREAVPRIPQWRLATLPKIMTEAQGDQFLSSFDRSTASGRRDYAMALCLTELGLRAQEVAHLSLKDIHWHDGTLLITGGKSRRTRILPLPTRVGQALANYLQQARPLTRSPQLFVRHTIPVGMPLGPSLVRGAMRRAYGRAGFGTQWTGTHVLRHTAATRMHQRGATLKEIADVLGHQSIDTSAVYAKVNLPSLSRVALPWPEVRL